METYSICALCQFSYASLSKAKLCETFHACMPLEAGNGFQEGKSFEDTTVRRTFMDASIQWSILAFYLNRNRQPVAEIDSTHKRGLLGNHQPSPCRDADPTINTIVYTNLEPSLPQQTILTQTSPDHCFPPISNKHGPDRPRYRRTRTF